MKKLKHKSVISFGKHKGKTVEQILEENPTYMVWVMNNTDKKLSKKLRDDIEEIESIQNENFDYLDIWDMIDCD